MRKNESIATCVVIALLASVQADAGPRHPKPPSCGAATDVVAKIGDEDICLDEINERVGNRTLSLTAQIYEMKRRALDARLAEKLLEKEALRRGVPLANLERIEITDKAREVKAEEVAVVYDATRERYQGASEAEAHERITEILRKQRVEARRVEYIKELEAAFGVKRLLQPPRIIVSEGDGMAKGPADAPVTIVVFSDFECPYCVRLAGSLADVSRKHPDSVRIVHRDFPLRMHRNAAKAAEAARCALDQGHFWEMSDKLYANSKDLAVPSLKRYAEQIGLDAKEFGDCLDSGRNASKLEKDRVDGESYGVRGTPAVFVNGRLTQGNLSADALRELIAEEAAAHPGRDRVATRTAR
jgi:protein-disulfide isomerase